MFEDSLMESTGRIRTRSSRYAAGSFLIEAMLVAILILIPYLYLAALPRKYLNIPLAAPPPPSLPTVEVQRRVSPPTACPELLAHALTAPSRIPQHITPIVDTAPPGLDVPGVANLGQSSGPIGALPGTASPPPMPRVHPAKSSGPLRISAGVAAGQLVVPIRPQYPAIALAARVEGTVVVAATISAEGRIESLHVLSGPPLLVSAAVAAIQQARYRPWKLNGDPIEVETTINVVFSLGGH